MKDFVQLIQKVDSTNKTLEKTLALKIYFDNASSEDKMWTVGLLAGKRPKRPVSTTILREWAAELSGIPLWLLEESYHITGDLAETIALLVPNTNCIDIESVDNHLTLANLIQELIDIQTKEEIEKKEFITKLWLSFNKDERFVFNKIITGGFRIGVSQKLMTKALAAHLQKDENEIAHRLMGNWKPSDTSFEKMFLESDAADLLSKPYPFYLAFPVEGEPSTLGDPSYWYAERKWDGIRGQIIKRDNNFFVWSRGEELVTDKFPEYQELSELLPNGIVLDGEIIAHNGLKPLPFNIMQTRIGRKTVSKKALSDAPIKFIAYDLLEHNSKDIRDLKFIERRNLLEDIALTLANQTDKFILSPNIDFNDWQTLASERDSSREFNSEGIMIKDINSPYGIGRKKGAWWKWKIDPMTIDAVLTYAMQGHGRRANLFTDYTFGLWAGAELVTFAKAYSGLTDTELQEIDRFVKQNTINKFGPVRQVIPKLVFEIAFEGIAESKRHKSGFAVRFPRIHRWRKDKTIEQANKLTDLQQLI